MLALDVPAFNGLAATDKHLVRAWLYVRGFDPVDVVGIEAATEDGTVDIVRLVKPFTLEGDELKKYRTRVKADGFPLQLLGAMRKDEL